MLGMFAFLGKMFGTAKAGEAVVNGVTKAVDEMFYTDQEEAQDKAEARKAGFDVYMEWLRSTSGSRLARRAIALVVTGIWAIEHIAAVVFHNLAIWAESEVTANRLIESAVHLSETAHENNALVGVVLLFYFGGPAAIDGVKGLVAKWTGTNKT